MSDGKWTVDSARAWLNRNGHTVGFKQVELSRNAGIAAFGCADYLRNKHNYTVVYFKE